MEFVISIVCSAIIALAFFAFSFNKNKTVSLSISIGSVAVNMLIFMVWSMLFANSTDLLGHALFSVIFTLSSNVLIRHKLGFKLFSSEKLSMFAQKVSKYALILLIIECTVLNYSAFITMRNEPTEMTLSNAEIIKNVEKSGVNLRITSNDEAVFGFNQTFVLDKSIDTDNISVTFNGKAVIKATSQILDENLSAVHVNSNTKEISINGTKTVYLQASSHNLKNIRIAVEKGSGLYVSAVALNDVVPFAINDFRLILLILAVVVVCLIKCFELYKIEYNPKSFKQYLAIIAIIILSCGFIVCLPFAKNPTVLQEYISVDVAGKSPYYQQIDAFEKGKVELDIVPDKKLVDAGNKAYDPHFRSGNKCVVQWDRALYDGKYYSYFGITPLLLFYYPVFKITNKIPTDSLTAAFFGILAVVFGCIALLKILGLLKSKPNLILTLMAISSIPVGMGIFTLCAYGDFYIVPKICAIAFLLMLISLSISAFEKPNAFKFALCGVLAVAVVAARPNVILFALALAPFYIGYLMNKNITLNKKIVSVASFMIPIAIGGALIMYFNLLRFGSVFEFGAKYQLTVNNVGFNNITLSLLIPAVFHYFFQPVAFNGYFPYIAPSYLNFSNYTRYSYMTSSYGIMNFPIIWSLFAYPVVSRKKALKLELRAFVILSVVVSILTALIDFCLAGLNISYMIDLAPIMVLAAFVCAFALEQMLRKNECLHRIVYISIAIMTVASIVIGMLLLLNTDPYLIKNNMPYIFDWIGNLFVV